MASVACGDMHSIAVLKSGGLVTWGNSGIFSSLSALVCLSELGAEYGQCGFMDFVWEPSKVVRMPAKIVGAC